jgi:hypothetical protein
MQYSYMPVRTRWVVVAFGFRFMVLALLGFSIAIHCLVFCRYILLGLTGPLSLVHHHHRHPLQSVVPGAKLRAATSKVTLTRWATSAKASASGYGTGGRGSRDWVEDDGDNVFGDGMDQRQQTQELYIMQVRVAERANGHCVHEAREKTCASG